MISSSFSKCILKDVFEVRGNFIRIYGISCKKSEPSVPLSLSPHLTICLCHVLVLLVVNMLEILNLRKKKYWNLQYMKGLDAKLNGDVEL